MAKDEPEASPLRGLPQVDRLGRSLETTAPEALRMDAARTAIAEAAARAGTDPSSISWELIKQRAEQLLSELETSRLAGVINATGVLLHTNLGRSPLSTGALDAVAGIASRYSNLEYDTVSAKRGSRYVHAVDLLIRLTGAESALVVNNNAAAVVLALAGMAAGREVIVSRGELIEIGGEFRIPEIMAQSYAIMREVGTTNRTRLSDYAKALTENTAAVMKVHPSNYRIEGFTSSVSSGELADLAQQRGVAFLHDLGSGLLRRTVSGVSPKWLQQEPNVVDAVHEGADLVTFSGDKLLGGPQAGIILGRSAAIKALHRSPLLRALRVDKMSLAALQHTLLIYMDNRESELPLWRMALASVDSLASRGRRVIAGLGEKEKHAQVVESSATLGGGSAPGSSIPSVAIRIEPAGVSCEQLHRRLLSASPPVVGRVEKDSYLMDVRTVFPEQDDLLTHALIRAL